MKTIIRPLTDGAQSPALSTWLESGLIETATLTSADPRFPIEDALAGTGQGWRSLTPGRQVIRLNFSAPLHLKKIMVRFEIPESRTQEFTLRFSVDQGATFRELVRQQFNFSAGSPSEVEEYTIWTDLITDIELDIIPDISGGPAIASLAEFKFEAAEKRERRRSRCLQGDR